MSLVVLRIHWSSFSRMLLLRVPESVARSLEIACGDQAAMDARLGDKSEPGIAAAQQQFQKEMTSIAATTVLRHT